jgi:hypothetical protein
VQRRGLGVEWQGGADTLTWLRRRREAARLAEVDAATLISEDRLTAYSEARQRQRDAQNADTIARVANDFARRTGKRNGLDTAAMAMGEDLPFRSCSVPDRRLVWADSQPGRQPHPVDPQDLASALAITAANGRITLTRSCPRSWRSGLWSTLSSRASL